MLSHQFSVKQLMVSCFWFCVGLSGIAFCLRPFELPLDPSYDFMATWLPIIKFFALVAGTVVMCLSVIPLVTSRRPVPILIFMLLGIGLGLFFGSLAAAKLEPRSVAESQRRTANFIRFGTAAVGAILPLALIFASDRSRLPQSD